MSASDDNSFAAATDAARHEFIENLSSMATGSYLRDEDREFWEAPFPTSAVDEAAEILHRLVSGVRADPSGEVVLQVISAHDALRALSDRHAGAVYEDEEVGDFRSLVTVLCEEVGADARQVLDDLDRIIEQE
ncbi:hypothetical protein [Corynebacterium glyciniphilum]|uniref:hypothetical protein n=1 Tax=Corynebacterium glyciniphilum TaxID=1404244 RepID=UPI0011AB459D|nr:hypothetical protein [Corynebacterium glyciniphilum]MDN5684416.1 hypothetical protein [Corynebacterium glyciniphilum]MDN6704803.1 hypothetical protein [Corynebacterium glyciniphilum]